MPSGNLYETLEVDRGADKDAIRRAYMKLSKQHHPDRGGDAEKFKEIQKAYETLYDDGKRQMYDMTGATDGEAPPDGGMPFGFGGGGPMPDIFSMFGGLGGMFNTANMRQGPPPKRRQKPAPKITEMPVSIHDFYYGKQVKISFERRKFCDVCRGDGALSYKSCNDCQGRGYQERMMQIGPGFAAVNRAPCGPCEGRGRSISKICEKCRGGKFMTQEKTLDVFVQPGSRPGEVLMFPNECSDDPAYVEPGDVHIVFQEADESGPWRRSGDDLYCDMSVTLLESLVGCEGRVQGHPGFPEGLAVTVPAGTLHGEVLTVAGRGMPKKSTNKQFGTLFVRVVVSVTEKDRVVLRERGVELSKLWEPRT
jgi:DnaJ-class molecular chaperone